MFSQGDEMEEFDIELSEVKKDSGASIQLPLNFLAIGEIDSDDVRVYIKQDVYKALEEYASSDTARELGTILLGDYSETLGKTHIIISEFIYAKYTDATASTLTFTHETWEYVHQEHDKNFPDKKIVGWQHTHPGYGIFLSNYDMFIQENFFNLPFQLAYVIDPVRHLRGFFQWKGGKVEKLKGFNIYDDLGKQIKIDQPKPDKGTERENTNAAPVRAGRFHSIAISALTVLIICLLFSVVSLSKKYSSQLKDQAALEEQLENQRDMIAQQAQEIARIKGTIDQISLEASERDTGVEPDDEKNETGTQQSTEMPVKPVDEETESDDGQVVFRAYTVQAGDTLLTICDGNYLDYSTSYRIILSVNGIEDADQIYAGQTILLPISK